MVTLAGPASNLLLAIVALILLLVIKHAVAGGAVAVFAAWRSPSYPGRLH